MTTFLTESELPQLRAMAEELGITLREEDVPPAPNMTDAAQQLLKGTGEAEGGNGGGALGDKEVEKLRRGLEDLYNLM